MDRVFVKIYFQGEKRMKIKNMYYVLSLLVAMSMVLAACAPQVAATTAAPVQTEASVVTEVPATEAPTEIPKTERHGGWLDEIDVSVVAGDSAVHNFKRMQLTFIPLVSL